jgi:glucan phosphoethanolaminetransferase (alkaline phosphatase superfamily)
LSSHDIDSAGPGRHPQARWLRVVRKALRLWAGSFAFSPLLVYLAWFATGTHRIVDALAGLAITASVVALPALFAAPGWAAAAWYATVNLVSTATLLCLAMAGELPTLGTAIVALRSEGAETSAMLAASAPAAVVLAACAALWLCGCASFWRRPPAVAWRASRWRLLAAAPFVAVPFVPDAGATYPLSLGRIARGLTEFSAQSHFVGRRIVDPFKVTRSKAGDELVVVLVGESSSARHWQINGYERETTPNLQRRLDAGEIANFTAHMSTAAITLFAVPALLSPFDEVGGIGREPRRSVVTVMSRAGYRTAWVSNNDPQPAATEADETTYRTDDRVAEIVTSSDEWLKAPADQWLRRTAGGPGFLVLHTYSSHLPFETRYPPQYARWTGDGYRQMTYARNQSRDNYDNSILYTDAFLHSVFTRLEQERRPTLAVYTSDHAETIMDGIARPDAPRDERLLHVPLFFWANRAWKDAHQRQWAALQAFARSGQPTSHVNIVPTLTGLLDIGYEGRPRHRDVLDAAFEPWSTTPALAADEKAVVQVAVPVSREARAPAAAGRR